MKINLIYFLAILFAGVAFTSCNDDDPCDNCPAGTECVNDECVVIDPCDGVTCDPNEICVNGDCVELANQDIIEVTSNISEDVTWVSGKCYILTSRIAVESGATLTIEPGVVVKGEAGTGANATALLVARGGKLLAEGTAEAPIIFTSIADEIMPGQIESPNLDLDIDGLWGGLIVLGNAPISADASAVQIEGIPPSDQNGLYGGSDPADNSGVIKYVSVRHGGANIGDGNEINGITLGGVGSGTVIEYVEVVSNQDDGIECFGGTVNISNALVWGAGDDLYDMDQAYSGTIDNFVAILGANSDHGMELDGPEGAGTGSFTLRNGSLKGNLDTDNGEYADLRDGVTCTLENLYFTNFKEESDVELDNLGVSDNWANGSIVFSNLEFNVSHLSAGNTTVEAIFVDKSGEREAELDAAAANFAKTVNAKGSVGANTDAFANWSLAAAKGELSGL
jgi:hypothetical protein